MFSACGANTATISKTDGSEIEALITDGNFRTLYATQNGSELIQIDRADIADIDHPGNVHVVAGSFLTVAGAASLYFGRDTSGAAEAATLLFGTVLAIWGLTSIGRGLYVWFGSTGRAAGSGGGFSIKDSGLGFSVKF